MRPIPFSLTLLLSASAYAQGGYFQSQALTTGNVNGKTYLQPATVPVIVYADAAGTTLASLYSDPALSQPVANPIAPDKLGNFFFWTTPGAIYYSVCGPVGQCSQLYAGVALSPIGNGAGGGGSLNNVICPNGSGCTATNNGAGTVSLVIQGPVTGFAINSFTGFGGTVELGTAVVNPTFAANYSATPSSVVVTNSDGVGSPQTLSAPYTSGSFPGTLSHNTTASVVATLTANGTQTATQTLAWKPAIFAGLGNPGATSSVTTSGTTATLSNGAVLARAQLGAESVGTVFGPYTATNQTVYLLLTGGSHTFVDPATGFTFPFNAPIPVTYTNSKGATVTGNIYASTYPQYDTLSVKVAN